MKDINLLLLHCALTTWINKPQSGKWNKQTTLTKHYSQCRGNKWSHLRAGKHQSDELSGLPVPGISYMLFHLRFITILQEGFPGGASGKEPTCQCRRHKRYGFHPWVRKILWRRAWQPTPVFLSGESHGQRSLVGYSPQDCGFRNGWSDWACMHTTLQNISVTILQTEKLSLKGVNILLRDSYRQFHGSRIQMCVYLNRKSTLM